jgi:hypothetical protein
VDASGRWTNEDKDSPSFLSKDVDEGLVETVGELGVLVVERSISSDRASLEKRR